MSQIGYNTINIKKEVGYMSNTSEQMKKIMMRIKSRRESLGLSFQQLADLTQMSKSTLQRYETGGIKNIPLDKLEILAKALQTTPEWILDWGRSMDSLDKNVYSLYPDFRPGINYISDLSHTNNRNIIYVPLVGEIACGTPILTEQNIERQILLPDTVRADFALRCQGDSMINAGIDDGDIVFIRSQKMVENGEIAAVQITDFDTEATLKKVYITDRSITLVAQNPTFEPITYTEEEMNNVEIVGKCVAVLKDFDK